MKRGGSFEQKGPPLSMCRALPAAWEWKASLHLVGERKDMARTKNGADTFRQVFAAVGVVLLIFSASVLLTLNCRLLYYLDMVLLGIEKSAGMSADVIRRFYNQQ